MVVWMLGKTWPSHPEWEVGRQARAFREAPGSSSSLPSHLLGIGFLQESTPEFIAFFRVQKEQLSILGGQSVINDHLYPLSVLPELGVGKQLVSHADAEGGPSAGSLAGVPPASELVSRLCEP